MKNNLILLAIIYWLSIFTIFQNAFSDVRLPRLLSDGMVLQREIPVKIWGWADVGEKITANFMDRTYQAIADNNGKWEILLSAAEAGGPYQLEIIANNHITIKDILIGDLWVCSGQSNMELAMNRLKDRYPQVIAHSDNPAIRQFLVPRQYDYNTPHDDFPVGGWESANPENVLRFTAVGYFFAKTLYEKYQIPIGLINSSVGGSPAEAWMSEDALSMFPAYLEKAIRLKDSSYIKQMQEEDKATSDAWYQRLRELDQGFSNPEQSWFDPAYDASQWKTMPIPSLWEEQGLGKMNGVVWFRKEIDVPASMTGKPARLLLGCIIDSDSVYINGVFVGTTSYQYPPRKYDVPENVLKAGKNTIVVRVVNSTGSGGFVKDKPYQLITGDQTIDLKGEWQYQIGAILDPMPEATFVYWRQPLGFYNGMIAPLLNYMIKGVIWYQGESNTGKPLEYRQLFPALITNWRQKWNQGNFPFLYVQLANYMQTNPQPSESNWAELREAQLMTLSVINTAMAVTIDIGEGNDIHPLNKEDVGKRLALAAQKIAYEDKKVVYSGPIYESMKIKGNKITLTFKNIGSGLIARGSDELKYFAIAGTDKKFVWAKAKIEGNKVVVWNDHISQPVAVRYAWADNPEGANLYNKEGLPASPFRTDK
jgi:sialate O-acetylesterase